MNRKLGVIAMAGLIAATVAVSGQRSKPTRPESFKAWDQYLGGADSSQYSSLNQIKKSNVARLEVAWTYPTGEMTQRFGPIVVDGVMYVLGAKRSIVALDAATGKEIWVHANELPIGDRGLNYWESEDRSDRRLLYISGGFLSALDARTGKAIATFGDNGRVDVRVGLNRDVTNLRPLQTGNPGRVFENLIILSLPAGGAAYISSPGDVHAYDVRTGELKWVFHSVPEPGEFGADTWPDAAQKAGGGVHNWSEFTVDEQRGIAYIPFGTARYDFYGANRHGANLFGNSLVALDARTGKRLWHFQTIHHDLWDYDLPASPKLLTVRHDGRNVDVVAQPTKHGFLFVFDRVTGAPLWSIEERPVPQSDVPGEKTWPTQPFPTAPPPFARQSFTEKDINPFLSDPDQAKLREQLRSYRNEGLFTPPSLRGTIQIPGHNGGANWGSSAVDPTKGRMYIVSKELPTLIKLLPPGAVPAGRGGRGGPPPPPPNVGPDFVPYSAPYDFMLMSNGLSAIGPPWSQLTAYDLNTGKILWQVPHGEVSALAAKGAKATGSHAPRGGPVVTGGGLIFIGTSTDRKLRAYDEESGKVVWEKDLPAASEGVPAVYEVGGRQYLAVSVGGNGLFPPKVDDQTAPGPSQYMVFALPERRAQTRTDSIASLFAQQSTNVYRRFAVDRAKMIEFYGAVLGLKSLPTFKMPAGAEMSRFQVGTSEIKLLAAPATGKTESADVRDAVGVRVLTFFFPDEAALTARFKEHGYPAPDFRGTNDGSTKAAMVRDPDGQWVGLVVASGAAAATFDQVEVGLTVSDIEKSRDFYRDFVSLEELKPLDDALLGTRKYRYRLGTTVISLWTFGRGLAPNADRAGIQYVVRNVEAVDARAKSRGVKIDRPLGNFNASLRTVWLADPDGITNYFAETARSRQSDPSSSDR